MAVDKDIHHHNAEGRLKFSSYAIDKYDNYKRIPSHRGTTQILLLKGNIKTDRFPKLQTL